MKCDEARRRHATDPDDAFALEHVAGCAECFDALEAADPVVGLMVAARPADDAAPSTIAPNVLRRWRPERARLASVVLSGLAISAALAAVAVEALLGVDPARIAGQFLVLAGAASAWVDGAMMAAQSAQSIVFGTPAVLAALMASTAVTFTLWLTLVRSARHWRSAL